LGHPLNFISTVILGISTRSSVPHMRQRDRAKPCNVVTVCQPIKAIDAIRWLERDCHAGLTHSDLEVVLDRMLHWKILLAEADVAAREAAVREQREELATARQGIEAEVATKLDQERGKIAVVPRR
jgi:hypothetical protein